MSGLRQVRGADRPSAGCRLDPSFSVRVASSHRSRDSKWVRVLWFGRSICAPALWSARQKVPSREILRHRAIRKVVAFMAGCWLGAWPGEIRSVLKKVCTQRSEGECDSYTSASPYVSETGISLTDAYKYYTANREQAKETYFRQASKIIQQHFE